MKEFDYTISKENNEVLVSIHINENFNPENGDIKIDFINPYSDIIGT